MTINLHNVMMHVSIKEEKKEPNKEEKEKEEEKESSRKEKKTPSRRRNGDGHYVRASHVPSPFAPILPSPPPRSPSHLFRRTIRAIPGNRA